MASFFIKQRSFVNGLVLHTGSFVMSGDVEEGNFGEARYQLYYLTKEDIESLPTGWELIPEGMLRSWGCNMTQLLNLIEENRE